MKRALHYLIIVLAVTFAVAPMAKGDWSADIVSKADYYANTNRSHYLLGSQVNGTHHDDTNSPRYYAWTSDDDHSLGQNWCGTYCGGWGADDCTHHLHFDCATYVWRLFNDVGMSGQFGSTPNVHTMYDYLKRNGSPWVWHPNPVMSAAPADLANLFAWSWATSLKAGDVLIFVPVRRNATTGTYYLSEPVYDPQGYDPCENREGDAYDHAAVCLGADPDGSPKMSNARTRHSAKADRNDDCSCSPDDAGVINESIKHYLDISKDVYLNPKATDASGEYCRLCWGKTDALFGYFTRNPTTPTGLTCDSVSCSCDGNAVLKATLKTSSGTAISGKTIHFFVDGEDKGDGTTGDDGIATKDLGTMTSIAPGPHPYYAKFDGDSDYDASTSGGCTLYAPYETTLDLSVPAEAECGTKVTLSAVLKDELGNIVAGKRIDFSMDNVFYLSAVTDAAGKAEVQWTATPAKPKCEKYTIRASYDGNGSSSTTCYCPSEDDAQIWVYASIYGCVFEDCNMNGISDREVSLAGWPLQLEYLDGGTTAVATTDDKGCWKFTKLCAGKYRLSLKDKSTNWVKPDGSCNCELRITWPDARCAKPKDWLFTGVTVDSALWSGDMCTIDVPTSGDFTLNCVSRVQFGVVGLTPLTTFKFHDLNMNGAYNPNAEPFTDLNRDGKWTPAEPFTDCDCDGYEFGEFFQDINGNGVWDPAEPFSDLDSDKRYDWAETPIVNWPFKITGKDAGGHDVCYSAKTGGDGIASFEVPPSDLSGYTAAENVTWCRAATPWGSVLRTTLKGATLGCSDCMPCEITRWEATTDVEKRFSVPCVACPTALPQMDFGNVCLSTVSGEVEIWDDGVPPQGSMKPGAGWNVFLAGQDVRNRDVRPSWPECSPLPKATEPPIAIPCISPDWYVTECDANGNFKFVDLPPGHYHMMEQVSKDYKLIVNEPLLSGFDLMCCPVDGIVYQNYRKSLSRKVYRVEPANDDYLAPDAFKSGKPLAKAAVLRINPTDDVADMLQAKMLCRESPIQAISLTKTYLGFFYCDQPLQAVNLFQSRLENINWSWPLLWEGPGTTWKLSVIFTTCSTVRFPGESYPGRIHREDFTWTQVTDPIHLKLFLNYLRTNPMGDNEMFIISDRVLYAKLIDLVDKSVAEWQAGRTWEADALVQKAMNLISERTIVAFPPVPRDTWDGTGIAEKPDLPAPCSLTSDLDWIQRMIFSSAP